VSGYLAVARGKGNRGGTFAKNLIVASTLAVFMLPGYAGKRPNQSWAPWNGALTHRKHP
jgi:hypothetical protein